MEEILEFPVRDAGIILLFFYLSRGSIERVWIKKEGSIAATLWVQRV